MACAKTTSGSITTSWSGCAEEHKPKMIMVGASAYPARHRFRRIGAVAQRVGAPMVTDMAHIAGPGRRQTASSPVPQLGFRHDHHAQDAAWPARGDGAVPREVRQGSRQGAVPGIQGGPLMHIIAAKAVCFKEAAEPAFVDYQKQIVANAKRLASVLVTSGFSLVSGGTDNHLMLVDVFSRGLTAKPPKLALGKAGITVNKNAIPFDPNPPMVASGSASARPPSPPAAWASARWTGSASSSRVR